MKNILILLAVVILYLPNAALAAAPDLVFSTDTVYDRANNLTWTKDASTPGPAACLPGTQKDWDTATGTYINCLNSNNYLGYNDWRVPTVDELRIFRDNGLSGATLWDMGFRFVLTGDYWTSSVINTSTAWIVSMYFGSVASLAKTYNIAVWPVRGPTNGACGTSNGAYFVAAPTTNICSSGTASAFAGTGPWRWTCTGISGGTTASCTAKVGAINLYDDVRSLTASQLNVSYIDKAFMTTLWFSQSTPWPTQYQALAQEIIEKGKNPGLGVRSLHAQGITGRGVNVAIIDQNLASLIHPEFNGKIVKYYDLAGRPANEGSMHGPAVTSLLVGETIGTAPGAKLYYASAPSWLADAQYYADALDWIIDENAKLPNGQKIRVVSVSAAPSSAIFTKNNASWNPAVIRANSAGILVLDCTSDKGITATSYLDLDDPDNISKVSLYPGHGAMTGHIYIPTSRTQAEEYTSGNYSYQYTGEGGSSWTVPYLAGVLAMGWQLRPELTGSQMMDLVFETAITNATDMKVLNPPAFIDRAKNFSANPPVNGSCGTSNGGSFTVAPTNNLCTTGTASTVSGTGPWSWSCTGLNGGSTTSCSALIQTWMLTSSAGSGGTISPNTAQTVNHGSTKVFTVTPNTAGYTVSVGGTCGGMLSGNTYTTNPITGNCAVSAMFVPPNPSTLVVTKTGSGTVSSNPAGISCGNDCAENYTTGTSVALTTTTDSCWSFGGWGGACTGTGSCIVSMTSAKSVWATFTSIPRQPANTYFDTVQKIFIGYYQRPADPEGLIYWAGRLRESCGNLSEIIDAFASSPESQALYKTINSTSIGNVLEEIYQALLGRAADAGGKNYYVAAFNAGRFTAATIMLNLIDGIGPTGVDRTTFDNKLAAANLFTKTIDPELDGSNFQATYAGDGDVIAARKFLTEGATSVRVPTQTETTLFIINNISDLGDPIPPPTGDPSGG